MGTVCRSESCRLHWFVKLQEWHKYTANGKTRPARQLEAIRPCEGNDQFMCRRIYCSDHMLQKAREWHKWNNGTPQLYRKAQRTLRSRLQEEPVEVQQQLHQGEKAIDKWYENQKAKTCRQKHAINCEDEDCERHAAMKQAIYNKLRELMYKDECYKHAPDGTGPTGWYLELRRQITEETIPDKSKNEARHL